MAHRAVFLRLALAIYSDWFIELSAFVAIGQSDNFGFGFSTLT